MAINKNILKNYLNPVFIETGSHIGMGIQSAIDAGFKKIHSIEISEKYYNHCREKFGNKAALYLGDSGIILENIMKNIYESYTIFLDSHFSGGDTGKGNENSPLLKELDIIKKYWVKGSIIIIDDIRCSDTSYEEKYRFEFSKIDILNKLCEINPDFTIQFLDSYRGNELMFNDDLLVAF
jgi:hypothetical protein